VAREEDMHVEKQRQKRLQEETVESQVARINSAFAAAKKVPRHPKKPNLKPKSIVDVFPCSILGSNSYTWVSFNDAKSNHAVEKTEESPGDKIAIKSWSSDKCALYTEPKNARGSGQFDWTREYQRIPTKKISDGNNLFFRVGSGRVGFSRYKNKLALRQQTKNISLCRELATRPSKITILPE
jgi:hypothetical protein